MVELACLSEHELVINKWDPTGLCACIGNTLATTLYVTVAGQRAMLESHYGASCVYFRHVGYNVAQRGRAGIQCLTPKEEKVSKVCGSASRT